MARAVLLRHHIDVLCGAAGRVVHTIRDHRQTPDGQPRHSGTKHEPGGAPVPPAGGAHAGHRRSVVLPVPAAFPGAYPVDHTGPARVQHHGDGGSRKLLPAAFLLPNNALHQLSPQSDPLQPHVVQVPGRIPPAMRPAPKPVDRPVPGPQGHCYHDVGADRWWWHHHVRYNRVVESQGRDGRRRRGTRNRGGQRVHQDKAQRRNSANVVRARRPPPGPNRQAVKPDHCRCRGHPKTPAAVSRELRLR